MKAWIRKLRNRYDHPSASAGHPPDSQMPVKKRAPVDQISTLLGTETEIEGALAFKGTIRLDGRVTGTLVSETGVLIIGERAVVKAEIHVGTALVKGTVHGRIKAADRIELHASARVTGDIAAPVISIESGAALTGNCATMPVGAPPEKDPPKKTSGAGTAAE